MRTFSGIELYSEGGNIKIPPRSFEEFLNETSKDNITDYLVVDVWEYTQPNWIFPLTQEKYENLL